MTSSETALDNREVDHIDLADLLLDSQNPRFGRRNGNMDQAEILDFIVRLGVKDVLSSLAVNGYFEAEPLVCKRPPNSNRYVVAEGNRRLAACLIITGDARACHQAQLSDQYAALWERHGSRPIDPPPAIVFSSDEQEGALLSYLGVRHIASAQPWDSYAKAAWIAKVVETNELSIREVATMIGDQHRTINRMLEGYYLVEQLVEQGQFKPEDSQRKGRGSVTEYPFSWVYTMLGYAAVRSFLALGNEDASKRPLRDDRLDDAGLMVRSMFGDRSKGRGAAIGDSRQLGELASALSSSDKTRLLEQGKTITEIDLLTQPIEKRLEDGLATVRDELRDLVSRLSEQELSGHAAARLTPASGRNRRLALDLDKRLNEIASGDGE